MATTAFLYLITVLSAVFLGIILEYLIFKISGNSIKIFNKTKENQKENGTEN